MNQRLIFIDFIRGAAIIGVILVHTASYGIWYNEPNALAVLPAPALAGLAPFILLGTWAGGFAMISAIANYYTADRRLKSGKSLKNTLMPPLVNSLFLMVISILVAALFTHRRHGMFGEGEVFSLISGSIALGRFVLPDLETLFYRDALVMISLSGLLSSLTLYLIWRKEGRKKRGRNRRILLVSALVFLGGSWLIQPLLWDVFEALYHSGRYLPAYFLNLLSGPSHVLLPYGGFALLGLYYGMLFCDGEPLDRIRMTCRRLGILFLAASAVFFYRTVSGALAAGDEVLVALFDYRVITPELYFFAAGGMSFVYPLLLRVFEFPGEERRREILRKTVWIRRFGIISLSIFILENVVTSVLGRIFHSLFGDPAAPVDAFMTNGPAILLYFFLSVGFWFTAVRLWEQKGFKYSFEWFIVTLGGRFRETKSDRLNTRRILYSHLENAAEQPPGGNRNCT